MSAIVALFAIALCGLAGRAFPTVTRWPTVLQRAGHSRLAPPLVGALCGGLVAVTAGTLHRVPIISDEASYLFQAYLFADNKWALPAYRFAEFFSQEHLLLTPFAASKYFPGHALLLSLGVRIGEVGLVPIVLTGVTGAFIFASARRAGGAAVAILTVTIWAFLRPTLYVGSSYMSETTSGAAWQVAYWATLYWYQERRPAALCIVAAAIGLMAITRPYTALAVSLPTAALILLAPGRSASRRLIGPIGVLLGILLVIPLWSFETTGDWRLTPLMLYTQRYETFDRLGFGVTTTLPTDSLPRDQALTFQQYAEGHRHYHLDTLGPETIARLRAIRKDIWLAWRKALFPFAVIGLIALPVEAWLGVSACVAVFVLYLMYWFPPVYTIYYSEVYPAFALVAAFGLARVIRLLSGRTHSASIPVCASAVAAGLMIAGSQSIADARGEMRMKEAPITHLAALAATLPPKPLVIFVTPQPWSQDYHSLVRNLPGLSGARVWFVYDRGTDDVRLIRAAPGRAAYHYDGGTEALTPMSFSTVAQ